MSRKILLIFFFLGILFLFPILNPRPSDAAEVCSTTPVDVVLVIDRSSSMYGSKLQKAKDSAKNFVDMLRLNNPKNRVGIATYATSSTIENYLTSDFNKAIKSINDISTNSQGSKTCVECGIFKGKYILNRSGNNDVDKVIILLTDGIANVTQESQPNVVGQKEAENAALNEVKNSSAIYYTIGLGKDADETFLKDIVKKSREKTGKGKYYPNKDITVGTLTNIYKNITEDIFSPNSISGFVFEDKINFGSFDEGQDTKLPGWPVKLKDKTNTTSTKTTTTDSNGNFNFEKICDGDYELTQTARVGYAQTVPSSGGYNLKMKGKSMSGYIFGNKKAVIITNTPTPVVTITPGPVSDGWIQGTGGNMRLDRYKSPTFTNIIPVASQYFSNTLPGKMMHGIVFLMHNFNFTTLPSNQNDPSKANEQKQLVANAPFKNPSDTKELNTSYTNVIENLKRSGNFNNKKSFSSDTLSSSMTQGIYATESDVSINSPITFTSGSDHKYYIFLIKGNLTIKSNIKVQQGTVAIFIVGGDIVTQGNITVDPNVSIIEGIYSAENNFNIESKGPGADSDLIINGSIIINAKNTGLGSLTGRRDLGSLNITKAGVQINYRPDFVLNSPLLFRTSNSKRIEVAPGATE